MLEKPLSCWYDDRLQVKYFELSNRIVPVYFAGAENKRCMISIPDWRWCFLYDYSSDNHRDEKKRLQKALGGWRGPLSAKHAKKLADELSYYMYIYDTGKLVKESSIIGTK